MVGSSGPAATNGFATGSPHVQPQALDGQSAGARPGTSGSRTSASNNNASVVNGVHASSPNPAHTGLPTMQLSQAQQQALLERSQQAASITPSAIPVPAPPPERRRAPPPQAPTYSHTELQGGPEWKVPLRRSTTLVRDTKPGDDFPTISEQDQQRVKQWLKRDAAYEDEVIAAGHDLRISMQTLFNQAAREQDWLGFPTDPQHRGPPRIQLPAERFSEQAKGLRGPYRKPVPTSKSYARSIASVPETLVPIRLEIEHEIYKLRDTFTWNLAETAITPQIFASHLCADLRLPRDPFEREIVSAVMKQLSDAQISANYVDYLADPLTAPREDSRAWLERHARKRRRTRRPRQGGDDRATRSVEEQTDSDDAMLSVSEGELDAKDFSAPTDELRLVIKLDVTLDAIQLVDQFEWDISNPNNSPEGFAHAFAAELGLSGEFVTAISHSIREQVDFYTRSLCILGYAPGRGIAEDDLRRDFLPPLLETFRTDSADDFTPALNQLTGDEVERHDREHEREVRRKRRQTKGRGVTLPDREPIRTHRTLVPRPLAGYVSVQLDDRGNKAFPQPELVLPFPLQTKEPPKKPANLETVSNSPLKLVASKEKSTPAGGLAGAAAVNRYRKALIDGGFAGDAVAPPPRPPPPKIDPASIGLHEHIIDGQWYCANCGCPAEIAIGRRKSPVGKDSLCGECGKHYHRFKRQRPVVYTRDYATHKANAPKQPARKRRGRAPGGTARLEAVAAEEAETNRSTRMSERGTPASQALSPTSSAHDDTDDEDESSAPSLKRKRRAQYGSPDRPFVHSDSADSDLDSEDEIASPPPLRARTNASDAGSAPVAPAHPPTASSSNAVEPTEPAEPAWLRAAVAELRKQYPTSDFGTIYRPHPTDPTWKVRCMDCPGKVYNTGPDQTLQGFAVHMGNKKHLLNVETRLKRTERR